MASVKNRNSYTVLGVMSGTSLDGLDLALVKFSREKAEGNWHFEVEECTTIEYAEDLIQKLKEAISWERHAIDALDEELGNYIGCSIQKFLASQSSAVDFIASHGHTILHQPDQGLTLQIGSGTLIHQITGIPVINNFRMADVLAGGQGAPLVPIGDRDLFSEFDMALNLGGIANISIRKKDQTIAYDICPFNMALNELAQTIGLTYDNKGEQSSTGEVLAEMLSQLNEIVYLKTPPPKSLGLEDYLKYWKPVLKNFEAPAKNLMRTYVEHAAAHISEAINTNGGKKVLATGGGAYHQFFISRLSDLSIAEIVVPENRIVEFKEAIVFAYLGLLRVEGKPNCLASVTGAREDVSGGDFYGF